MTDEGRVSCGNPLCTAEVSSIYVETWNRRTHRPDSALRVALEECLTAMRHHQKGQYRFTTKKAIETAEAALAQPQDAPQYDESALDRFAEAGAKAWANPPESAKLIRQVEVEADESCDNCGEDAQPAIIITHNGKNKQGWKCLHCGDEWWFTPSTTLERNAQRDGERLDWLEKSKPFILAITPEESRWEISEPFDLAPLGSRLLGEGETLRAAIDLARSRGEEK